MVSAYFVPTCQRELWFHLCKPQSQAQQIGAEWVNSSGCAAKGESSKARRQGRENIARMSALRHRAEQKALYGLLLKKQAFMVELWCEYAACRWGTQMTATPCAVLEVSIRLDAFFKLKYSKNAICSQNEWKRFINERSNAEEWLLGCVR